MIKIMFVCHGNICRSTMAEFLFKDMVKKAQLADSFFICSSATSTEEIGNSVYYGTIEKLDEHGIPWQHRKSVQITAQDYHDHDFIIIMDERNHTFLSEIITADPDKKIHKLLDFTETSGDIADPWYTRDFDTAYNEMTRGCDALLHFLETSDQYKNKL